MMAEIVVKTQISWAESQAFSTLSGFPFLIESINKNWLPEETSVNNQLRIIPFEC